MLSTVFVNSLGCIGGRERKAGETLKIPSKVALK